MTIATSAHDEAALEGYGQRRHYDVAGEFWRLWLDPRMTYSAALWEDGDDLARAQLRKLDYMIEAAGAPGEDRVLDIGCGWGSAAGRLLEAHDVGAVVGITVSASQVDWIASRIDDPRLEVRLEPWADHRAGEPYDSIVSIGAFEHVARERTTRDMRVAAYREFFEHCHGLLRPEGRMSLQTCARGGGWLDRAAIEDMRLIDDVLVSGAIPWPSEVLQAAENLFQLEFFDTHDHHSVRTWREWERRLEGRREAAIEIVGEEVTDTFLEFHAAWARRFEHGHTTLVRMGLRRL
jgi:cyclopropane-fatty-acyl-phospholipid synthase